MGRITRYSSKPKTKYLHEVRVGTLTVDQAWLWEEVERIAGHAGYKKRSPFWACTIIAFETKDIAQRKSAPKQKKCNTGPMAAFDLSFADEPWPQSSQTFPASTAYHARNEKAPATGRDWGGRVSQGGNAQNGHIAAGTLATSSAVADDLEMARSADLVEAEPIDAADLEFLDSSRVGDLAWSSPKEIRSPLNAVGAAIVAERKR